MQALVYKSTGNWYQVKNKEGQSFKTRLKGKFKIDEITSTNPIAVGDIVEVEIEGLGTLSNSVKRAVATVGTAGPK